MAFSNLRAKPFFCWDEVSRRTVRAMDDAKDGCVQGRTIPRLFHPSTGRVKTDNPLGPGAFPFLDSTTLTPRSMVTYSEHRIRNSKSHTKATDRVLYSVGISDRAWMGEIQDA